MKLVHYTNNWVRAHEYTLTMCICAFVYFVFVSYLLKCVRSMKLVHQADTSCSKLARICVDFFQFVRIFFSFS